MYFVYTVFLTRIKQNFWIVKYAYKKSTNTCKLKYLSTIIQIFGINLNNL